MQSSQPIPAIPVTPIVERATSAASPEISMIDVTLASVGLTGVILAVSVVTGLIVGVIYAWYQGRRPVSTMEARGGSANLLRDA